MSKAILVMDMPKTAENAILSEIMKMERLVAILIVVVN